MVALSYSGHHAGAAQVQRLAVAELQRALPGAHQQLAALTLTKLRAWQLDSELLRDRVARLRAAEDSAIAARAAAEEEDEEDEDAEDDEAGAIEDSSAPAQEADPDESADALQTDTQSRPPRSRNLVTASAAYDLHVLGGMVISGPQAGVGITLRAVELALRVGYSYLDTDNDRVAFADDSLAYGELDVAALLRWRPRSGYLEAALGGSLRAQRSTIYGALRGQYDFGHGVALSAELGINQLTEDTLALRVLGTRDRVLVSGLFEPVRGFYLSPELQAHAYWSRSRSALGYGFLGFLEAGYHARRSRWSWDVRGAGYYLKNQLPDALPADVCVQLADGCATDLRELLEGGYATIGGGPRLRYGLPAGAASRSGSGFYALIDIWLGALLNADLPHANAREQSFGYDLQLGLGVKLPRAAGTLSASGYLSNIRSGGFEGVQWGLGVRYLY